MDDELLAYYNSELIYLRELGADFAQKYPKVAARLLLEADRCEDPHVERLLEGVAFLTARIRKKIDDELPEITEAFLSVLYPHFLRPLPSLSIAQFQPLRDPGALLNGYTIPRHTRLSTRPIDGTACQFQTAYPVTLCPVEIQAARLIPDRLVMANRPPDATSMLQLSIRCLEPITVTQLGIDHLRFYLNGEPPVVHALFEMILNHACEVQIRASGSLSESEPLVLSSDAIQPVGFGLDEGLFPYAARSFPGYRLLQEFFAFPEKFLFFDLLRLEGLATTDWGNSFEILIFFREAPRVELNVDRNNLLLGCTPIVNLFPLTAEPIPLDRTKHEYLVIPDVSRVLATEVYSIEEVTSVDSFLSKSVTHEPFYAMQDRLEQTVTQGPYWYASRRPSVRKGDSGSEVYITFVDKNYSPTTPSSETVTVRTLSTNRDLPAKLPFGGGQADLEMESPGPVGRVRCLKRPTAPLRPPWGRDLHWRLISHLSLNHLSLTDSHEGLEALQEILRLYDWTGSSVCRQQIRGITRVSSRRIAGRSHRVIGNPVALGQEITIEFDESEFVGSGVFLFSMVLERFFGLYASINSFTQTVARTRQREGILKRWPPRAGDRTLL